ncbi:hypothetical protein [Sphingomonas sp. ASV193]|uniref:hypothetical protein n=1 Tax=Sphingomonas sp. ASV193 TaxID=3144405 RepID=UPI0032E8BB03
MLGLFKKKPADPPGLDPEAPIEIKTSIRIERDPAAIYPLLDFADERHHMKARGNPVKQIGSSPDEFRAWSDRAPNLNFLFQVETAIPGEAYAYFARIVPPVGKRIQSFEAYTLEPIGDGATKLTAKNIIQNQPGLSEAELQVEIARSTQAMMGFLTKLKIHAEEGVDRVIAFEREIGQRPAA